MKRRDLLMRFGALGMGGLGGCVDARQILDSLDEAAEAATGTANEQINCFLTPAQTAGPFYFNVAQVRRNITEGRPGVPLRLELIVVDGDSCTPIPDALVDIWHTDAFGRYSGYAEQGDQGEADLRGETFMRGIQVTDGAGAAVFETIYPGWYPSRTAHIHFMVHLDRRTAITSQLYFEDAITDAVYQRDPYNGRGPRITNNANDFLSNEVNKALQLSVKSDGEGYRATHRIGVTSG